MSDWHVLRVSAQRELITEREIKSLGYDALCPYVEGHKRVNRLVRKWKFPLFTGYVFVSLPDWATGWHDIAARCNTTERKTVYRFLGGEPPAVLHARDVAHLRAIADGKYNLGDIVPRLRVGDQVLISDGVLKHYSWKLKSIRGRKATIEAKEDKNKYSFEIDLAKLKKA